MGEVGHGAGAPGGALRLLINLAPLIVALTIALVCFRVSAAEVMRYGERIEGYAQKFDFPLEAESAKDRHLKLSVRLPAEPIAFPSDMEKALKFACVHHGPKMRETARRVHNSDDWTVRVTFDWIIHKSNGVTVTDSERAEFLLSDCSEI